MVFFLIHQWNVVVILYSNWSAEFCHAYFYLTGVTGLAQMGAAQGALLLRLYVMSGRKLFSHSTPSDPTPLSLRYHRSFKVMAPSIALFVIELVFMVTVHIRDAHDLIREYRSTLPTTISLLDLTSPTCHISTILYMNVLLVRSTACSFTGHRMLRHEPAPSPGESFLVYM